MIKNIFKVRRVPRYASFFGIALLLAAIIFGFTACDADDSATVSGVKVSPSTVTLAKGGTKQFTATVSGTNNPAQTVKWTVEGGVTGTTISASGLLTVAIGESAATLTVRATSTLNKSKSGTAEVTLTNLTWTAAADSTFDGDPKAYIQDITWGGNKFVAVGRSGQLASSSDGVAWTSVSTTPFTTKHLQGICWGNGKFIAVGQDRSMGYSADGTTGWTLVEPADTGFTTGYINYVASNGSTFVAAGQDGLSKSADGTTWTAVSSLPGSPDFRTITYTGPVGSQQFIAVGGGGYIIHSSNGDTWTEATYKPNAMENNARWRKIAWGAGKYVVVGGGRATGSYIAYSTNLQTWTDVTDYPFDTITSNAEIMDIVFADGAFFAVGTGGVMANSKDGISWTEMDHPLKKESGDCAITCIAYGNNRLVMAERFSGKIAYSVSN